MLALILSLLSITIGVIIKNLVDLSTKSNKNKAMNKLGRFSAFLSSSKGTICVAAARVLITVMIFVL